ncbi:MAG: hypothetical protein JW891_10510 [Candidatus Lokiarchaeota archaeon]|nr:hypothetical protein [Candidatus Lokiarchaeota archaeon]
MKKEGNDSLEIKISKGVYVDGGIARFIKNFNKWGYTTKMSCSAMISDGHNIKLGYRPFISFERPSEEESNPEVYFRFLVSVFKEVNYLEELRLPYDPELRAYWYLNFQPLNSKDLSEVKGLNAYLPYGMPDDKIFEKFKELHSFLRQKDFFKKLSRKETKDGEDIIQIL